MAATIVGPAVLNAGVPGGNSAALNITGAQVIKAGPGLLMRVCISAIGSGGTLTFNDCLTTGAAAAANQIVSIAQASLALGQVITLEWPCATGIVVSAFPTGGAIVSCTFS
jgi:hypothetical protein